MSGACSESHPSRLNKVFQTGRGCVLRCRACGTLELRYGNIVLMLATADLDGFIDKIASYDKAPRLSVDEVHGQPIGREYATFYLGATGVGFTLDREEISELHRLLVGTRLMVDLSARPPG